MWRSTLKALGRPCVRQIFRRTESTVRPVAGHSHSPMVAALWQQRVTPVDIPKRLVVKKTPAESQSSIVYKFSSDADLRDAYSNPWGTVRTGRIIEDLDAMAGNIAWMHCQNKDEDKRLSPLVIVTASVDHIQFARLAALTEDSKIEGSVIWTGTSSLKIRMKATTTSKPEPWLVADFSFVARDPVDNSAAAINELVPTTPEEIALFNETEALMNARKEKRKRLAAAGGGFGLEKWHDKEQMEKGRLLLEQGRLLSEMPTLADRNTILLKHTAQSNVFICQPQHRNPRGRIFGGFLMRRAIELAYATAYCFAGTHPRFLNVNEVVFQRPVNVGDMLKFEAVVLYSEPNGQADKPGGVKEPCVHVEVLAWVTQPENATVQLSNRFNLCFSLPNRPATAPPLRTVFPSTTGEARRILAQITEEDG